MTYWTESGWTVFANSVHENLQFKQSLPFALIGSGAHCHVRLPVQDGLDTAYFACNFDDRIELWPLCAIAFPVWGVIPQEIEVLLGQFRLRCEKSIHCSGTSSPIDVELTMSWGQKTVTKAIARPVTIFGSQHPSVWRTRGRQMLPCDHAIVCVENRIWLVDLHPPERSFKNPPIYELTANGQYYQIGDMRLSRGKGNVECHRSIARRRHLPSDSGAPTTEPANDAKSSVSLEMTAIAEQATSGSATANHFTDDAVVAKVQANAVDGLICPEMLTTRLTGRLVSINQSRFTHARLIRISASLVTFVAAIAFLFWLFR